MRNVFLVVVAVLLGIFWGPFLTSLVDFIPIKAMAITLGDILVPDDLLKRPPEFWGQATLWSGILWVLFRYGGFVMGFIRPPVAKYADTKFMRRIQGVFAEIIPVVIILFLLISLLPLTTIGKEIGWRIVLLPYFFDGTVSLKEDFFNTSEKFEKVLLNESYFKTFTAYQSTPFVVLSILIYLFLRSSIQTRFSGAYVRFVRVLDQGRFGFGGVGRFTGLLEEWALRYQAGALFMGRSLFNPFLLIGLKDPRHMLTLAGSRSGKGVSAIIPNLLLWKGSVLVIDPKGTNTAVTAAHRRAMGQQVYVVDPFNITEEATTAFNPMTAIDPASPFVREHISLIADALVVRDSKTKDPHWDDGARTILAGLIGQLLTAPG